MFSTEMDGVQSPQSEEGLTIDSAELGASSVVAPAELPENELPRNFTSQTADIQEALFGETSSELANDSATDTVQVALHLAPVGPETIARSTSGDGALQIDSQNDHLFAKVIEALTTEKIELLYETDPISENLLIHFTSQDGQRSTFDLPQITTEAIKQWENGQDTREVQALKQQVLVKATAALAMMRSTLIPTGKTVDLSAIPQIGKPGTAALMTRSPEFQSLITGIADRANKGEYKPVPLEANTPKQLTLKTHIERLLLLRDELAGINHQSGVSAANAIIADLRTPTPRTKHAANYAHRQLATNLGLFIDISSDATRTVYPIEQIANLQSWGVTIPIVYIRYDNPKGDGLGFGGRGLAMVNLNTAERAADGSELTPQQLVGTAGNEVLHALLGFRFGFPLFSIANSFFQRELQNWTLPEGAPNLTEESNARLSSIRLVDGREVHELLSDGWTVKVSPAELSDAFYGRMFRNTVILDLHRSVDGGMRVASEDFKAYDLTTRVFGETLQSLESKYPELKLSALIEEVIQSDSGKILQEKFAALAKIDAVNQMKREVQAKVDYLQTRLANPELTTDEQAALKSEIYQSIEEGNKRTGKMILPNGSYEEQMTELERLLAPQTAAALRADLGEHGKQFNPLVHQAGEEFLKRVSPEHRKQIAEVYTFYSDNLFNDIIQAYTRIWQKQQEQR